jgi:putative endonuclease
MIDGDEIVFVEVKTRTGDSFGHASESITSGQARRVIGAAERFIASCPTCHDLIWRCDIVGVTINPRTGSAHIDHVKNALIVG